MTRFIFRGDLNSYNGYSKAIRSYAMLCSEFGSVYGIRKHQSKDDGNLWPWPIICDDDLFDTNHLNDHNEKIIVIHVSTPDNFYRFPNSINVGCFFWETNIIPAQFSWIAGLNSIDWLWEPSTFLDNIAPLKEFANKLYLPWPTSLSPELIFKSRRLNISLDKLSVHTFNAYENIEPIDIVSLRDKYKNIYLSISTIAPRKGVPQLINAWQLSALEGSALIIKLNLKHHAQHFNSLEDYLRYIPVDLSKLKNVYFITDTISESELDSLYNLSDFYITCSLGEGFGGPIAEAIIRNLPVVLSRHSSLCDLISHDHPLIIPHSNLNINLQGNLDVYPYSSTWNVPNELDLIRILKFSSQINQAERIKIAQAQGLYFNKTNSLRSIKSKFSKWLKNL